MFSQYFLFCLKYSICSKHTISFPRILNLLIVFFFSKVLRVLTVHNIGSSKYSIMLAVHNTFSGNARHAHNHNMIDSSNTQYARSMAVCNPKIAIALQNNMNDLLCSIPTACSSYFQKRVFTDIVSTSFASVASSCAWVQQKTRTSRA